MFIPAFTTTAMTLDFLSSIFLGWVLMFLDSHRTVLSSQLVRFAMCCTSVLDFHSKNLQITSKLLTQGYRYHKLRKTFGKFIRSELLFKFGKISFQEYVSEGISHLVFYGHLVYKLRRVKYKANFVSSDSKIVKRLRPRKYDPVIIERTIGLVFGASTALYRSFLNHCTPTNKAGGGGGYMTGLVQNPMRRQGPDPRLRLLLVKLLQTWARFQTAEHSLLWRMYIYLFWIYCFYHLTCLCDNFYGLSALVGCWSSFFIKRIIYKFLNVYPFDNTAFAVSGKVGIP